MTNDSEPRETDSPETADDVGAKRPWHHVGFIVAAAIAAQLGVIWRCT